MRRQELLVRRLLWEFCRAKEEHVLAEVRETREIGRVVRRTDVDAESGRTVPATQRWPSVAAHQVACARGTHSAVASEARRTRRPLASVMSR